MFSKLVLPKDYQNACRVLALIASADARTDKMRGNTDRLERRIKQLKNIQNEEYVCPYLNRYRDTEK